MNINQLVKLARGLNPNLKVYAVISMAPTHPALTEAEEAHELLMELPEIELSRVFIRERKVSRDAMVAIYPAEGFSAKTTMERGNRVQEQKGQS